ncbi:hypothetical protein [Ohessyouella blattaphilus]|uniref:Sigma-70 family RNA polymerase sigma factor n=1 Tax=Ohessyouella blattaphilus TaxID=2949333 RepID=A0ABT1EHT8_9FIRM|nr:hypothetical protein [Ohessyouella blattaphilus]MCP1110268.1 hypothetical protein [Ohessyouella blattaphilus]MCR8563662.1 hypothetical protein [Ohessyouella blattaphilus]
MKREMSMKEVIYCLQTCESFRENESIRYRELKGKWEQANKEYHSNVYARVNLEGVRKSTPERRDILYTLELHEELFAGVVEDINYELQRLYRKRQIYKRIRCCYSTLEGLEREIILKRYIQNKPYKEVLGDFKGSQRTFERLRLSALENIRDKYNSRYSDEEIVRREEVK